MNGTRHHLNGPLHHDAAGDPAAPPMVMLHPNPLDRTWALFQQARFSAWFRTIAIDLPGYGLSPTAVDGLTLTDVAEACWETVDRESAAPGVLLGCSVGAKIAQHMYHLRPDRTSSVILTGTGHHPPGVVKNFPAKRVAAFRSQGMAYRREYAGLLFSPAFRDSTLGRWLVDLYAERADQCDADTIVRMFEALAAPDQEWLTSTLDVPVLIVSGSLDNAHPRAPALRDALPDAELAVLEGAGHACQLERPWAFDDAVIRFLRRRDLWPG
jgi:3-oxoadipate enol-lactonase